MVQQLIVANCHTSESGNKSPPRCRTQLGPPAELGRICAEDFHAVVWHAATLTVTGWLGSEYNFLSS